MVIDIIFLLILVFAIYKGLRRGFIIALVSVIGFIAGLAAALKLSAGVAVRLSAHADSKWWPVIAFLLVFFVVVILVNICGRLIQKGFETALLGWANRIFGALLYAITYTIVFSVFLFYAVQLHLVTETDLTASVTWPILRAAGPRVIDYCSTVLPALKNMFSALETFFAGFSK